MRTVVCRFEDLAALRSALHTEEPELVSPEPVGDGEWVLVVVELGGRATALAARGVVHESRTMLSFEPRDWEVLRTFSKTLPPPAISEPTPETDRSPRSSRRSAKRAKKSSARILVVDDDPDLRDVVSAMLEAVGLHVETAKSAEEALARVKDSAFDLLVLDWMLPGKSGLDLCREIRLLPKLGHMPVLFLTANTSPTDMVEAFASGADDYVVKPFRAPELGARIFGLLRRAGP